MNVLFLLDHGCVSRPLAGWHCCVLKNEMCNPHGETLFVNGLDSLTLSLSLSVSVCVCVCVSLSFCFFPSLCWYTDGEFVPETDTSAVSTAASWCLAIVCWLYLMVTMVLKKARLCQLHISDCNRFYLSAEATWWWWRRRRRRRQITSVPATQGWLDCTDQRCLLWQVAPFLPDT